MKTKKQYLIVDVKKHRRHSAPENLGTWTSPTQSNSDLLEREYWCRASVSDFSVLLENQSESGSSLELDTSNLSRDLSPIPTTKSSPRGSYQNIPISDFEELRGTNEDDYLRHSLGSWFIWKNILLSQAVAGCLAIMELSNENIKQNSQNFVTNGQNLPHYIILGVFWTTKLALRNDGRDIVEIIKYSGFRYLILSVLHVESNYLLSSSFHHSTYLGNQMIDGIAASLSLVIAYVCLEVQFHFVHISGFGFSILGAIGLCIANIVHKYQNQNQEDVLLGDVLRIGSGICLAFNSIAQELIIKSIDLVECLGMIGLIGSLICGFQSMALETNKVIPINYTYWSNILSHCVAQFFLSSLSPIVLRDTGATGLHLALILSGFFSYFIGAIYQKEKFQLLYLLSFAASCMGITLYTIKRTTTGAQNFFPVTVYISKGN